MSITRRIHTSPSPQTAADNSTPSTFNIANILTVARVIAVPIFIYAYIQCYFHFKNNWWITVWLIFIASAITDKLDGYFARKYHLTTPFGTFLDPVADKMLIGSACILLSYNGKLPWWFTLIVVGREVLITVMRIALSHKKGVIPASMWGKHKATFQFILIAVALIPAMYHYTWGCALIWVLIIIAAVSTIVSGALYCYHWLKPSTSA